jgi:hypothetical protein
MLEMVGSGLPKRKVGRPIPTLIVMLVCQVWGFYLQFTLQDTFCQLYHSSLIL